MDDESNVNKVLSRYEDFKEHLKHINEEGFFFSYSISFRDVFRNKLKASFYVNLEKLGKHIPLNKLILVSTPIVNEKKSFFNVKVDVAKFSENGPKFVEIPDIILPTQDKEKSRINAEVFDKFIKESFV